MTSWSTRTRPTAPPLYAGQGTNYGGGIRYDANGVDDVSFPPDDNVEYEVFRYKHNSDEVIFNGDITVKESFVRRRVTSSLTLSFWTDDSEVGQHLKHHNVQVTGARWGDGLRASGRLPGSSCYEWARARAFRSTRARPTASASGSSPAPRRCTTTSASTSTTPIR